MDAGSTRVSGRTAKVTENRDEENEENGDRLPTPPVPAGGAADEAEDEEEPPPIPPRVITVRWPGGALVRTMLRELLALAGEVLAADRPPAVCWDWDWGAVCGGGVAVLVPSKNEGPLAVTGPPLDGKGVRALLLLLLLLLAFPGLRVPYSNEAPPP
jgi:hypothetical protein